MTTPEALTSAHFAALRDWARGMYPLEAATELLIRAFGGAFAHAGNPWIHVEDKGGTWIDFDELTEALDAGGTWSGGERRILALAASLGDDTGLLSDNVPGLSRENLELVLAALSHAGGSHEHHPTPFLVDDAGKMYRNPDRDQLPPLHAWPQHTD